MNEELNQHSQLPVCKNYEKMQSENITDISIALIKLQSQLPFAAKESSNPYFKSKYADLATVWSTSINLLTKYELALVQTLDVIDCAFEEVYHKDGKTSEIKKGQKQNILITTLIHSSGQWIRSRALLNTAKRDPQGEGSAITYMRRYQHCAILGIIQDDDDGERAMDRKKAIKEVQFAEIDPKEMEEKFKKFVETVPEDQESLVEYLIKYTNHYKISPEETIKLYKDGERFANDFEKWKSKQAKK